MSKLLKLQQQRREASITARNLLDSVDAEKWGSEEQSKYDALTTTITNIDNAIDREQQLLQSEAAEIAVVQNSANRNGTSTDEAQHNRETEKGVFNAFLRGGIDNLTSDQRAYVEKRRAQNALSGGASETGGYLVPTEFATRLIEEMKTFGNMRAVATVQGTASGAPIEWPTVDDTMQEGEIVGENGSVGDEDPEFGIKTLNAFKYSSKGIAVPFELLQDAAIDLESYIIRLLAQRIARISNRHFTLGTGINQPKGIVPSANQGIIAATSSGIVYDDLVGLEHSVDLAYRINSEFMLSDMAVKAIKFLKDAEGRPLWVPGIAVGEPDTILGYKYTINQYMDAPAAGKKPVVFGELKNYMIRDVMAATLFRMTDSAYTRKGQVGFLAFSRHDGGLLDASGNSVKFLQNAG